MPLYGNDCQRKRKRGNIHPMNIDAQRKEQGIGDKEWKKIVVKAEERRGWSPYTQEEWLSQLLSNVQVRNATSYNCKEVTV